MCTKCARTAAVAALLSPGNVKDSQVQERSERCKEHKQWETKTIHRWGQISSGCRLCTARATPVEDLWDATGASAPPPLPIVGAMCVHITWLTMETLCTSSLPFQSHPPLNSPRLLVSWQQYRINMKARELAARDTRILQD